MPEQERKNPHTSEVINSLQDHQKFLFYVLNNQFRQFKLDSLIEKSAVNFDFPLKTWFYHPTQDDMSKDLKKFKRDQINQERFDQYYEEEGNLITLWALTLEQAILDHIERAYHDKCKTPNRAIAHMAARLRIHGSKHGYWQWLHDILDQLYNEEPFPLEGSD